MSPQHVGPLEGTRVIDLTRFVSGSYATMVMASLGAEVLKIEVPPDGDSYRGQGAVKVAGESALFQSLNRGKRSVTLDFRDPEGFDALERLLATADFFVHNARPGTLDRYGLDYESVHSRHSNLIYASISGYGDVGPESRRGGFDVVLQAESGVMSVTGSDVSGPVKVGAPLLDVGASLSTVVAVLAAHIDRQRTGRGTEVASSLLEFGLAGMTTLAADTLVTGVSPGLLGTHSPSFSPYGGFRTGDGYVVLAGAGSEQLWGALCVALGCDHLINDPRFSDNAARLRHRNELIGLIESALAADTAASWAARLNERGVPAGRVRSLADVLGSEQVAALDLVQQPCRGSADERAVGVPFRIGGRRPPLSSAPRLGADAVAVLGAVGTSVPGSEETLHVDLDETIVDRVVRQTIELAAIPAPPRDEKDRTARVASWWRELFDDVRVDAVGNVWAAARPGPGNALVIVAHLDTVFGREIDHCVRRNGSRLEGPSVGDDSVAVASLAALDELLPRDLGRPVWLLATVGEEGLGDLLGMRHALSDPVVPIDAVIAVEGNWLGRVCAIAVGSVRYRVTCNGPGGHAWEASDVESAVHVIATMVADVVGLAAQQPAGTTINIGRIGGGTAINARAAQAWFEVDLRADSQQALDQLDARVRAVLGNAKTALTVDISPIGRRPAGSLDPQHRLVTAAVAALANAGMTATMTSASTDANAAHAAGIPAIAVGVTVGANEHTEAEWIDITPLRTGLDVLASTVVGYLTGES